MRGKVLFVSLPGATSTCWSPIDIGLFFNRQVFTKRKACAVGPTSYIHVVYRASTYLLSLVFLEPAESQQVPF